LISIPLAKNSRALSVDARRPLDASTSSPSLGGDRTMSGSPQAA
jgi:hypothetical protein